MKKGIFFLFFTIILLSASYAQEQTTGTELSEIRKNEYKVDLDVKNFFSGFNGASIIFKKKYQRGNLIDVSAIKSLRLSVQFNNQITFTKDPTKLNGDTTQVGLFPSNVLDFQVGFGFEKQVMHKGFVHYYGIDAIVNYYKNDDDYSNGTLGSITINNTLTSDRFVKTIKGGINPFFGVKYYFSKRISVGLETGIELSYFNMTTTETKTEKTFVDGVAATNFIIHSPITSQGIITKFNNLRFLTVGYTF